MCAVCWRLLGPGSRLTGGAVHLRGSWDIGLTIYVHLLPQAGLPPPAHLLRSADLLHWEDAKAVASLPGRCEKALQL